jgi:SAM-dependent methyltransferase
VISPNLYSSLARYYDIIHTERDYPRESEFIAELARTLGDPSATRVLDLFCGTGGHSLPFARLGFDVVGLDTSEDMLILAKRKSTSEYVNVRFEVGDCRSLDFTSEFDLVLCLGQSFQYLLSYEEIRATFCGVRRALRPGGLWIFDVIDGWQMLAPFETRRCYIASDGTQVLRSARTELDKARRVAVCNATWIMQAAYDSTDIAQTVEEYRILFADEVAFLLTLSGFEVLGVYGDGVADAPAGSDCVAVTFVARALTL